MRNVIALILSSSLIALAATPALSETPAEVRAEVQVTPADVESREAVAHLYQRVNAAAASVCAEIMAGSFPDATSPYASPAECRAHLVDNALKNTTVDPLARYYAEIRSHHENQELASR